MQVYWCSGVEQCLTAPSPPAALAQYLLTCTAQLGALTRLVRGTLPDLHRRTLSALITIDVHARDVVDNLIRQEQHCLSASSESCMSIASEYGICSQNGYIHAVIAALVTG